MEIQKTNSLTFQNISFAQSFSFSESLTCGVFRSSRSEVFLVKGVLKICSKFAGEHPSRSVISKKLHSSCVEITLRHGCSPVNLLHIFRALFLKNTSGRQLLHVETLGFSEFHLWITKQMPTLLQLFSFEFSYLLWIFRVFSCTFYIFKCSVRFPCFFRQKYFSLLS